MFGIIIGVVIGLGIYEWLREAIRAQSSLRTFRLQQAEDEEFRKMKADLEKVPPEKIPAFFSILRKASSGKLSFNSKADFLSDMEKYHGGLELQSQFGKLSLEEMHRLKVEVDKCLLSLRVKLDHNS